MVATDSFGLPDISSFSLGNTWGGNQSSEHPWALDSASSQGLRLDRIPGLETHRSLGYHGKAHLKLL